MSYEDLIARLRQYAINRGDNPADWRTEAADALEHMAQSHDVLVAEIATLQAELAQAKILNEAQAQFAKEQMARTEAAEAEVERLIEAYNDFARENGKLRDRAQSAEAAIDGDYNAGVKACENEVIALITDIEKEFGNCARSENLREALYQIRKLKKVTP